MSNNLLSKNNNNQHHFHGHLDEMEKVGDGVLDFQALGVDRNGAGGNGGALPSHKVVDRV